MKKKILTLLLAGSSCALFAQTGKKELSLEDIYVEGKFRTESVYGLNSMKDGKHFSSVERDPATGEMYLVQYEYQTGKATDTILRSASLKYEGIQLPASGTFSSEESKILLKTDVEPIYRRSTIENNFIYDRKDGSITPLSEKGRQKYANFSPDASRVAFVRDNNLFIKNLKTGEEKQITSDGKYNHIINGGTDWVYEEEFEFARAFFWSPDGKKIAYYKFNESEVKQYNFAVYDQLYPTDYRYKYPKPGEANSVVSIHIYDLESGKTVKADIGEETNQYIPRIKWTQNPSQLCIFRMNRHQNKLEYLLADAASGQTRLLLTRESDTYISINDDLHFLSDGEGFVFTSERNGYNHIYLYGMDGEIIRQVTDGSWEVTALYGIDEERKLIYFQSAENSPLQRDIYSISLKGTGKKKLSDREGSNDAVFSADFSYFINYHSAAGVPTIVTVNNRKGEVLRTLEDNSTLKETLSDYDLAEKEFLQIPSAEDGIMLNAWMIRPPDFDPSKKYPVFMYVYGGPGSQTVTDSWAGGDLWYQLMAQKGYIVVSVDNRGTGGRGAEFKKMTYLNLGKMETEDQIAAAEWLATQSYVDGSRIGIYGWSYGGYMASLCITRGAEVFKAAVAGAPVTSWRFYDSIYTERYLRTPQENEDGYDLNSPIHYADQLKGNYLLIHGTADDNVHFQNSVEMAEALVKAGKQFQSFFYPNEHHGVRYRYHLQTMITDFILENL
ncbi:S9 family peptidase [Anseongella ginsenosidimutans]|nr:S9 family peptidase [Anseongella ginsenosidimutans]QEC52987.1 S9 family peptidase [Anseongella ginsenosidimutans]